MRGTVLLDDLRCDGSAHGGCQAGCRLYWKEEWLRRVDPDAERQGQDGDALAELEALVRGATRGGRVAQMSSSVESYRCQATEALRASEPLSRYDLRQYVREFTSGNVGFACTCFASGCADCASRSGRRLRLLSWFPLKYRGAPSPTGGELDLETRVTRWRWNQRRKLAPSVDENGRTRGLSFYWEMLPYCGGRFRVQDRVERIIDEGTGRMIEISSDCLILEGVVCSGEHSNCRWFCPRAIYPFWREAWLRRVEDPDASPSGQRDAGARSP